MDMKTITVGERTFVLRKFSAGVGFKWASRSLGSFISSFSSLKIDDETELLRQITDLINKFTWMKAEDMAEFQRDCLSHVIETTGGIERLVCQNGRVIPDLSNPDIFSLCIQSFAYTLSDFFTSAFLASLKDLFPMFSQKTGSATSSLFQSSDTIGNNDNSTTEPIAPLTGSV